MKRFKKGRTWILSGRDMVVSSCSEWSVNLRTNNGATYNLDKEQVNQLTMEGKLSKGGTSE